MKGAADRFSKKWIYIPLYFVFLVASIWVLFNYLSPSSTAPSTESVEIINERVPTDFIACFNEHKQALGGTIGLTPTVKLMNTFEDQNQICFDEICRDLTAVGIGVMDVKEIYLKVEGLDECLTPMINNSQIYHWQMLEKLPLMGLFFNSGVDVLSSHQKRDLGNFLEDYGAIPDRYGLLIIGRASRLGGLEGNKSLSRLRSESIIEFVDKYYRSNIKTEFLYFGSEPPQLNKAMADRLGIDKKLYKNVQYGSGADSDYALRLNQSVLLVVYTLNEDPFDRKSLY